MELNTWRQIKSWDGSCTDLSIDACQHILAQEPKLWTGTNAPSETPPKIGQQGEGASQPEQKVG
jgi:hypothetical protein